jgi:hypothetical protein
MLMQKVRGGIIKRVPVSVEKPNSISLHGIPILIPVPAIVSVCSVLYVENGVSKAGFSVCRVLWLWFCHAAVSNDVYLRFSCIKINRNETWFVVFCVWI